jgi:hypothetical protein
MTSIQNQTAIVDIQESQAPQEALLQSPRLRGGDIKILIVGPNRFALLPVERTKDEDDDQDSTEECQSHSSDEISSIHSGHSPVEKQVIQPQKSSITQPLVEMINIVDSQSDAGIDDLALNLDNSHADNTSKNTPESSKARPESNATNPQSAADQAQFNPITPHNLRTACSGGATDGNNSQTPDDSSKPMLWEEDNWSDRKVLGVRALSWTRSRLLLKYRQGAEDVAYFVERETVDV